MVDITEHHKAKSDVAKANLAEAEALVVSRPGTLMGEPCIKGTRIPVYMIAALAGQEGIDETHETYPFLTHRQIELAMIFAEAHPRREGPKTTQFPEPKGSVRRGVAKLVEL